MKFTARHLRSVISRRRFRPIAFTIALVTLSTGITQNSPSPLAILVLTSPGLTSVTVITDPFAFRCRALI